MITYDSVVLESGKLLFHLYALVVSTVIEQCQLSVCSRNGHGEIETSTDTALSVTRQQRSKVLDQIATYSHIDSGAIRTFHVNQRQLIRLHATSSCCSLSPLDKVWTACADRITVFTLAVWLLGLRRCVDSTDLA